MAATQVSLGAITLLPLFLMDGIAKDEYRIGPVLAMIALGVFGSGFAYIWNFTIMRAAGSAIASSVTYVTPVVAVVVGLIFLQEKLHWYEPVGALVVLLGLRLLRGESPLLKNLREKSRLVAQVCALPRGWHLARYLRLFHLQRSHHH